jgi:hypothetical protein
MKNSFLIPGLLWLLLSLACILVIIYGLKKVLQRSTREEAKRQRILFITSFVISVWICLLSVLAYKGFFSDFSKMPPRVLLALLLPLPFVLLIAFSKTGTKLLQLVPPHWLIFMQSFRIFVEILLWLAFTANMLPVQMTFEGGNFDILSGLLALPLGYILLKKKTFAPKLAMAFNVIGILLLLNILIIAVLSMPTPFRYFMNEPANTLVATFPFILLPGLLVPIAYSFHIFSLRQLLTKNKNIPGKD